MRRVEAITTKNPSTPSTSTSLEAERCARIAQAELAKCAGCNGVCHKELTEDRYWQPAFENGEWTPHRCEYYVPPEPADLPKVEEEPEDPMTAVGSMFGAWHADMARQIAEKRARLKPQYEKRYGRKLTDEEYLQIEDAEHKLKDCADCNGHYCLKDSWGWLPYHYPKITVEGGVIATEMVLCDVWRKFAYKEQCDRAGVPRKYIKRTFDDYEVTADNAEAVKSAKWFLRSPRKKGLYLYGGAGTGKTFLASLIACEHIRNYKRLIFGDVPELLGRIKDTFGKTTWENERPTLNGEQLLRKYCKEPLIILDDFGAGQITEWTVGVLYHIVNERYNNDRVTIVTSNYDLKGLGERLNKYDPFGGQRIVSRLEEMCQQAFLGTVDRRKVK